MQTVKMQGTMYSCYNSMNKTVEVINIIYDDEIIEVSK